MEVDRVAADRPIVRSVCMRACKISRRRGDTTRSFRRKRLARLTHGRERERERRGAQRGHSRVDKREEEGGGGGENREPGFSAKLIGRNCSGGQLQSANSPNDSPGIVTPRPEWGLPHRAESRESTIPLLSSSLPPPRSGITPVIHIKHPNKSINEASLSRCFPLPPSYPPPACARDDRRDASRERDGNFKRIYRTRKITADIIARERAEFSVAIARAIIEGR